MLQNCILRLLQKQKPAEDIEKARLKFLKKLDWEAEACSRVRCYKHYKRFKSCKILDKLKLKAISAIGC